MPPPETVKAYQQALYCPAQSTPKTSPLSVPSITVIGLLNVVLLGILAVTTLYYVVSANQVASQRYSMTLIHERAAVLVEENTALNAKKQQVANPFLLSQFAKTHNMVEAKEVTYLFENNNVALGK